VREEGAGLFSDDRVSFSAHSLALARREWGGETVGEVGRFPSPEDLAEAEERAPVGDESQKASQSEAQTEKARAGDTLTEQERLQVEKLRARDAEVRAHEAAHMAAGGAHVRGGASYSYQTGPDGKAYAIGGEVSIDVSAISGNPQATIQKMQQLRAAALAPAEPSGADRAVAATASQTEARARQQLTEQAAERARAVYEAAATMDPEASQPTELDTQA